MTSIHCPKCKSNSVTWWESNH